MVQPSRRSRTLRRVHRKTPGGKTALHFEKRKPSKAKCGQCGKLLPGVPRERPHKMTKLPKTKKRPERPYGGVLCSACMRKKMVASARATE
ncbi:50S ribosomal protein L34e [Candidatus Woesearchaeota archaeon]|nr:50S ribosomal protein L34e [Candidatus Woesearchaeota archaeon]